MPGLIQNHQKRVTAERLKKMYTTLRTAIDLAELDNGERENWSFATDQEAKNFYNTEILSHMNCIRRKSTDINYATGCYLSDGGYIQGYGIRAGGLLEVYFYPFSGERYTSGKANGKGRRYRLYYSTYLNQNFESLQYYGNINKYTRDYLLNSGPGTFACKNSPTKDYRSCFYVIMKDNWEIKDDYPW